MSSLKTRKVRVGDRVTTMRLEPAFWAALENMARDRGEAVDDVITGIAAQPRSGSLTSAVRVWIVEGSRARDQLERELVPTSMAEEMIDGRR